MATAATDRESVRFALSRGALHYLIKPFTAADGMRLRAYAPMPERLTTRGELTQSDVDRAVRALYEVPRERAGGQGPRP